MKVWSYVFLATGLILLLQFAGIPTGANGILSLVGLGTSAASVNVSSFFDSILGSAGILVLGIAAGVVAGFLTRTSPENYVLLPIITGPLALFVASFVSIMNYSLANHASWISAIVVMILAPLTVGYVTALAEFFRGTD